MTLTSLKDFLKAYKSPQQFERLSFNHYFYEGRPERLDLISNQMLGISAKLGPKHYMVGDVSREGFSYAQEVPKMVNMTPRRIRNRIREVAQKNEGRTYNFVLFFIGDTVHPELLTHGRIANHQVFVGLSHQEIEREIGSVLYKKGVKRGQDPNQYYEKMESMLRRAYKVGQQRKWDRVSMVAMNVAFLNLIGEIGAPPELYERLIDDYPGRTLFVKYGVQIEDAVEALKLFSFAKYRDASFLSREEEKRAARIRAKQDYFAAIGAKYTTRAFLELVWKSALKYYELSLHIPFPHPTSKDESEQFSNSLEAFNGQLQRIADNDYRSEPGPNEFELFLSEALYWHLIDKDKKYLDRSLIVLEVQGIMASCFGEAMAKAGWTDGESAEGKGLAKG